MDCYFLFFEENSQRKQSKSSLIARLKQVGILYSYISPTKAQNIAIYTNLRIINNEETDDENDSQDLPDISTLSTGGKNDSLGLLYDKDIVYPKNSIVIIDKQYEEYIRLKTQSENVNESKVEEV